MPRVPVLDTSKISNVIQDPTPYTNLNVSPVEFGGGRAASLGKFAKVLRDSDIKQEAEANKQKNIQNKVSISRGTAQLEEYLQKSKQQLDLNSDPTSSDGDANFEENVAFDDQAAEKIITSYSDSEVQGALRIFYQNKQSVSRSNYMSSKNAANMEEYKALLGGDLNVLVNEYANGRMTDKQFEIESENIVNQFAPNLPPGVLNDILQDVIANKLLGKFQNLIVTGQTKLAQELITNNQDIIKRLPPEIYANMRSSMQAQVRQHRLDELTLEGTSGGSSGGTSNNDPNSLPNRKFKLLKDTQQFRVNEANRKVEAEKKKTAAALEAFKAKIAREDELSEKKVNREFEIAKGLAETAQDLIDAQRKFDLERSLFGPSTTELNQKFADNYTKAKATYNLREYEEGRRDIIEVLAYLRNNDISGVVDYNIFLAKSKLAGSEESEILSKMKYIQSSKLLKILAWVKQNKGNIFGPLNAAELQTALEAIGPIDFSNPISTQQTLQKFLGIINDAEATWDQQYVENALRQVKSYETVAQQLSSLHRLGLNDDKALTNSGEYRKYVKKLVIDFLDQDPPESTAKRLLTGNDFIQMITNEVVEPPKL